eukprot:COSAG02_NODE_503_length_20999_cov_7.403110_2_plen_121_part_00
MVAPGRQPSRADQPAAPEHTRRGASAGPGTRERYRTVFYSIHSTRPRARLSGKMMKLAAVLGALAVANAAPVARRQWRQLSAEEKQTCVAFARLRCALLELVLEGCRGARLLLMQPGSSS